MNPFRFLVNYFKRALDTALAEWTSEPLKDAESLAAKVAPALPPAEATDETDPKPARRRAQ